MPAFANIGQVAKDILTGGFQYDHKVTVATKTAGGATVTCGGKKKGEGISGDVKVAHSLVKGVLAEGTITSAGKIDAKMAMDEVAPGLKCSVSASIPDKDSGKLSFDYGKSDYGVKGDVGLRGSPKVDLSAAASFSPYLLGAAIAYDSAKGSLTKYDAGVQYKTSDFTAALLIADKLDTVKVSYVQSVNKETSVALEVCRKLSKGTTSIALGGSQKLAGGAVTKASLNNTGVISLLYQQDLRSNTVGIASACFDAKNLDKSAKVGLELKVKP
mmetsp:Transcript_35749/g.43153  ORF Transcript_35749/g.43153 Transcript_35749/m.43153 type:complete len:272 (+) Transcript_35749:88-903(+)|eukprot:CAMPEP_0197846836 /NCGR_PEP_ID=MMETSP1438-20131217/4553_1 /TAXON_ID=1461541 /ORGANISM="Pterosperma sp., Strain CCMP1384" /LENGTH=271 /DNA_ID=CAMNT_0043458611 /DNA_START=80 /DNA_END=895 /DNA_ORIENTATION=+